MKGSGVIDAYHMRRVAPLMSRVLPLYLMAPGASLDGMALTNEALPPPKWHSASRRRWSLRRTMPASFLILCIQCRDTLQCGRNRGTLTL